MSWKENIGFIVPVSGYYRHPTGPIGALSFPTGMLSSELLGQRGQMAMIYGSGSIAINSRSFWVIGTIDCQCE